MDKYPHAVNLPFNGEIIRAEFLPAYPGAPEVGGAAYWVLLQAGVMVIPASEHPPALYYGHRPEWIPEGTSSLIVGRWKGRDLRVAVLPKELAIQEGFIREAFNANNSLLDDITLTLGGFGLQVSGWDHHSHICSRCGAATTWIPKTWGKRCDGCGYEHFPHIHPCVIVLVKKGEEFLLARKATWPPGRYSLIAGFVDIGESLEECVRREVKEETGVDVGEVRYVGSQCWPFPSQLMTAFVAEYAGGEIKVDGEELEDARWFTGDRMPESLPGERSIARWIIDRFACSGVGTGPTP